MRKNKWWGRGPNIAPSATDIHVLVSVNSTVHSLPRKKTHTHISHIRQRPWFLGNETSKHGPSSEQLHEIAGKHWQRRGNARNYLEMTRLFPSVQHFQLSCAMARPFIAGDAVRVADEEELRSLVAGHADLCWSTACETMVGCHGASAAGIFTSESYWMHHFSGWWFGTFIIFPYIGNNHPNWLIFFRGIETTNHFWRELMAEHGWTVRTKKNKMVLQRRAPRTSHLARFSAFWRGIVVGEHWFPWIMGPITPTQELSPQ